VQIIFEINIVCIFIFNKSLKLNIYIYVYVYYITEWQLKIFFAISNNSWFFKGISQL